MFFFASAYKNKNIMQILPRMQQQRLASWLQVRISVLIGVDFVRAMEVWRAPVCNIFWRTEVRNAGWQASTNTGRLTATLDLMLFVFPETFLWDSKSGSIIPASEKPSLRVIVCSYCMWIELSVLSVNLYVIYIVCVLTFFNLLLFYIQ